MPRKHTTYQIIVKGELDENWSDWFGGLTITVEETSQNVTITKLNGPVVDQAALLGILVKLGDLNLELLSLTQVKEHPGAESG